MDISESLLGLFIFLILTALSFLAFFLKEKFFSSNPDKNLPGNDDIGLSQTPSFESHEMDIRYIQQDMVVSSDTNVNDM